MAFTAAERDKIREWLDFAAIFRDADPQLESAITAVQSQADGGSQLTNATELRIRDYLTRLATLDQKQEDALDCAGTLQVGNIQQDKARQIALTKMRMRELCHRLASALATLPYGDPLSPAETMNGGRYLAPVSPRGGWP